MSDQIQSSGRMLDSAQNQFTATAGGFYRRLYKRRLKLATRTMGKQIALIPSDAKPCRLGTALDALMRKLQIAFAIAFAASATFFAWGETVPTKPQNQSGILDARQIMEASIAATQRDWRARLHYTYSERDENLRRDLAGHVKSEVDTVTRTILVNGVPFDQLVERDGKPPSAAEERRQKDEIDKLKREKPEQRAERLRKQGEEDTSIVQEVPKAFDFQLVGEEVVNGRPAYVLQATPHPGYHARGKYGGMYSKVAGKLWVDKQDLGWIKVEAQVIHPFSMGLFLVRLLRGAQIKMAQTRLDGGIWMPARVEVRAEAKIFFVKSLMIDRVMIYSEYRLPQAGAPTTASAIR